MQTQPSAIDSLKAGVANKINGAFVNSAFGSIMPLSYAADCANCHQTIRRYAYTKKVFLILNDDQ